VSQADVCLPVCLAGELPATDGPAPWLVEHLWSRTGVGFIGGQPKLGKTWLGLDLAISVATATPCLDTFAVPEQGSVLVYLAEDHPSAVRNRLAGLCAHRGLDLARVPIHVITAPVLRLDLAADRSALEATVAAVGPRLLLLDPLVRLHRRDENCSGDVSELLAFLRGLQRQYELAIIVAHHMRKGATERGGQALRGSSDLHAWTDSALYLRRQHGRLLLTAEHRAAPPPEPVELELVTEADGSATRLALVRPDRSSATIDAAAPCLADRILAVLTEARRPLGRFDLRRALRVNNQRLGAELTRLEAGGVIQRDRHGWIPAAHTSSTNR
jgi:hypothetical protein